MSLLTLGPAFIVVSVALLYYVPFHISLLGINLLTLAAFGYDKYKSKTTSFRTSESMLLMLCVLGGWIGAASAMVMFRHKTRKISFLAMFAVATVANLGLALWLAG